MTIIITHPGSAHLDDFLSTCLVLYRARDIEEVHRREPTQEEINDPSIWKLDVGDKHEPDLRCYDHHQYAMNDCTLSLLLKGWDLLDKALTVHTWLKIVIANDVGGAKEVTKILNVSYTTLEYLDSYVERKILELFEKKKKFTRQNALFSLMKIIGQKFFIEIDEYFTLKEELEGKIEFLRIKDVPIVSCYKDVKFSRMLLRLLNEKKREVFQDEKGGIAIYPNTRPPGTIALSRYHDDKRVDFTRISHYEKVTFAHPKGFFASLDPLSDYELEQYLKDAIIGKNS
ncbi:MAG: hypothetical protein EU535_06480 [Promethearchaeota archaeon]|nr:MAG: hypothetical protein EU535_06480 [Candidatus Lokiarchaeota archaeon]